MSSLEPPFDVLSSQTRKRLRSITWLQTVVRGLSFWLAISLPWIVLGLAVAGYTTQYPTVFGLLVAATVLCAIIGQGYRGSIIDRPKQE